MSVKLFDHILAIEDDFLSVNDIQQALLECNIPKETIEILIQVFDESDDGLISREEAMEKIVQTPAGKQRLVEEFNAIDVDGKPCDAASNNNNDLPR